MVDKTNKKEEKINTGMRFPESLLAEIEKIKEIEKKQTVTEVVVDLCWKGIKRYYWEKKVIAKAEEEEKAMMEKKKLKYVQK